MSPSAAAHLVCVFDSGDALLLPHLIDHYRGLGIESFYLIRHAQSTADAHFDWSDEIVRDRGLRLFHTSIGPWDEDLNPRLIRFAMYENHDDWYVIADLDEFHRYDRPLPELIGLCERGGYDHVNGCFLDRVAADGGFPDVDDTPLARRYPLAGPLSSRLLRALPLKTGLVRGHVDLVAGQHGAPAGRGVPVAVSSIQVHHFKWTATVLARLRRRVGQLSSGQWRSTHPATIRNARRFLSYVDRHDGRIDVTDGRLGLHLCGDGYADYGAWPEVTAEAQGWRWTLGF